MASRRFLCSSAPSTLRGSGIRAFIAYRCSVRSSCTPFRPIITFIIILLLPSCLTFITLLIHRIRAARAAQRDRAPESVVFSLPSRVWTSRGWEKEPSAPFVPADAAAASEEPDLERGPDADASTSAEQHLPAWVEGQVECTICLENFVEGDRVRVLPCYHLFHIHEIDEWLLHKKKLVRSSSRVSCAAVAELISCAT